MNTERAVKLIAESIKDSMDAIKTIDPSKLAGIALRIVECYRDGGKVMLCGNGGSASQAQHLAAELVCRFRLKRSAMNAISLTTDTSILTALANDIGFEIVFERQVEAYGRRGDVLIGLSTSGRSENVVKAFLRAKKMGISVIAFVGNDRKCRLAIAADEVLFVQSNDTPRIQEAHIVAGHIVCELVEAELASSRKSRTAD